MIGGERIDIYPVCDVAAPVDAGFALSIQCACGAVVNRATGRCRHYSTP